ncbi:hypothetical protein DPMN_079048 [Dreissena polymorpha]|uniref:Uncharacterized protein n=1 Tax=Dreissena polymorpha TaxID=45954 RepID=A0A9D3YND0_DREPO|nr:hypothetical protein DPMN_079048 [Dreissena polymorpha]
MHPLSFRQVHTSANYCKYSFFPYTIVLWNGLPASVVQQADLEGYKQPTGLSCTAGRPTGLSCTAGRPRGVQAAYRPQLYSRQTYRPQLYSRQT